MTQSRQLIVFVGALFGKFNTLLDNKGSCYLNYTSLTKECFQVGFAIDVKNKLTAHLDLHTETCFGSNWVGFIAVVGKMLKKTGSWVNWQSIYYYMSRLRC